MKQIIIGSLLFVSGALIGHALRTRSIDIKLYQLYQLSELVKRRNNEFLSNFADLYSKTTGTEGKFTEVDEYIQKMWMD